MPPQPHTLWNRVLQELQQLPTLEGQAQLACARKLMESAQAFGDLEFVPRAAWKQLIQELQVPKHLGEACCKFQADIDSGTGASSSSGGRSGGGDGGVNSDTRLCRRTVWAAMLSFLTRAAKDLLPDSSGLMGPGLSNLQNISSNKLVRTVTDQLQQFLRQIPDMYRAMAQHLQAANESAAAAAAAAPRQPAAYYPPEYELYTYAAMLSCAPMISSFQPTQAASVGMFREAAGLVVAGMRYMTTALPLTLGADRTTMCMQVVEPLPPIFSNVVCLVASPGLAAAGGKLLLESPDVRTLLSLMVFAVYASTFIPQTHASSRSRNRRAGRLQGPEQAAEAVHAAAVAAAAAMQQERAQFGWACGAAALEQPQQQQQLLQPPPPQQQQQQQGDVSLQTTGVSMEAVAWYAAHTYSNPNAHDQLHALSVLFAANVVRKVMGHHWCFPVGEQQPQQQQQQQEEEQGRSDVLRQMRQFGASPEAVRARAHRCLLLAQVLLSAADRQRNSATFAADCGASLSIARLCLEHAVACYADLQEAPQGYSVLCAWWKPVLPLLLRLMQYVLQQLQAGNAGVHVAAALTDSSGSINGQLPGAAAMTAALQSGLAGLVSPLFRLLGAGSQHVGTLGCDESAPLSHAAAALFPSISNTTGNTALWQDNSVQLCTAVEGLLRMQAHGAVMSASRAHGILDDLQRLQATRGVVYELGSKVLNCANPLVAAAGSTLPGSKQQLQLFSLMCSYLKLCDYITPLDAHAAKWGYWRATTMTGAMLEDISSRGLGSEPGKAAAAAGTPVAHEQPTAASAAAAAVQSEAGPPGTAVEGLPWLVLVGRCCLQSRLQHCGRARCRPAREAWGST